MYALKYLIVVLCVCLFGCTNPDAQNTSFGLKEKSLKERYLDTAEYFNDKEKFDSSLVYIKRARKIEDERLDIVSYSIESITYLMIDSFASARESVSIFDSTSKKMMVALNFPKNEIESFSPLKSMIFGLTYYKEAEYDSVALYINQYLNFLPKVSSYEAPFIEILAESYSLQNQIANSIKEYTRLLNWAKGEERYNDVAAIEAKLAENFNKIGKKSIADSLQRNVLGFWQIKDDPIKIAISYFELALIDDENKLYYLSLADNIARENNEKELLFKVEKSFFYELKEKKADHEKLLSHLNQAINLADTLNLTKEKLLLLPELSHVYLKNKETQKALDVLNDAQYTGLEIRDLHIESLFNEAYANIFKETKDFESGFSFLFESFINNQTRLQNVEKNNSWNEVKHIEDWENMKKEKTRLIKLGRKKIASLKEDKKDFERKLKNLSFAVGLILCAIAFFYTNNKRITKRELESKEIEAEKQRKIISELAKERQKVISEKRAFEEQHVKQMEEASKTLIKSDKAIKKVKEKIKKLKKQNKKRKTFLDNIKTKNDELQVDKKRLETSISVSKDQIKALNTELNTSKKQLKKLEKIRSVIQTPEYQYSTGIFSPDEKISILFKDIVYLEKINNRDYVKVILDNGEHLTFKGTMTGIMESGKLPLNVFIRVHQTYIINYFKKIKIHLDKDKILMSNGDEIGLSRDKSIRKKLIDLNSKD